VGLIGEKNQRSKISLHCPFKETLPYIDVLFGDVLLRRRSVCAPKDTYAQYKRLKRGKVQSFTKKKVASPAFFDQRHPNFPLLPH
jgi:hypothetical protein